PDRAAEAEPGRPRAADQADLAMARGRFRGQAADAGRGCPAARGRAERATGGLPEGEGQGAPRRRARRNALAVAVALVDVDVRVDLVRALELLLRFRSVALGPVSLRLRKRCSLLRLLRLDFGIRAELLSLSALFLELACLGASPDPNQDREEDDCGDDDQNDEPGIHVHCSSCSALRLNHRRSISSPGCNGLAGTRE